MQEIFPEGEKETKLRSNPNENIPSLLHKEQKWEMEVEM